jgi:hypothetical protein
MYARLIQTSLCRQREFLADHSASQFTRNPLALAMALDLIQSESLVRFSHPQEDSLRHMLFVCNSRKYSGALSTHPSVEERIKRLAPSLLDNNQKPKLRATDENDRIKNPRTAMVKNQPQRERFVPTSLRDTIGSLSLESLAMATELLEDITKSLRDHTHQVEGAKTFIAALLLIESGSDERPRDFLKKLIDTKTVSTFEAELKDVLALNPLQRSALFEVAINTLKRNEIGDNQIFVGKCVQLVDSEKHGSFFESVLVYSLVRSLVVGKRSQQSRAINQNRSSVVQILAACSWVGSPTVDSATKSLQTGLNFLTNNGLKLKGLNTSNRDLAGRDLYRALQIADEMSPSCKETLLLACASVFGEDGMINLNEKAYLRILSGSLDAPIPLA